MNKLFLTLTFILFVIPFGMSQELPSYVPTDGLVAYYPFNGNANDESGNGNHGTVNGATLANDQNGNENKAYEFIVDQGASWGSAQQEIEIGFNSSMNSNFLTLSAWVNPRVKPSPYNDRSHSIFGRWDGGVSNEIFRFVIGNDNALYFQINDGNNNVENYYGGNIPFDSWTHVAAVLNEKNIKLYVNGQMVSDQLFENNINITGSSDLTIASMPMANGTWYFFDGYLDEMGYWNRALTEQEIQNLYTSSTGDIILNGVVSAESNQIKNVADPTEAQDAVTLSLLQTKLDELIERIEVLESDAKYNCGLAYFEDFSSCDLSGFNAQGGNITSTSSSFNGCGVYMTHYAGQDPNNFYATDKKFLYGVYELEAIADNGISDNIIRVLQQEELTGGYTFSLRPTGTDNPGWSVYNDGELVDSADTFPVARGNWYHVKIEVLKSSLKLWINDVVLFETDSITPPSDIPGYFKVGVAYSGGFDNLKFTPDSSLCK